MGTIAKLAERIGSKVNSVSDRTLEKVVSGIQKVVPDDKMEKVGEKIKGFVGEETFDKIESVLDDADDRRIARKYQEYQRNQGIEARRAMMLNRNESNDRSR
ncbi:hypothetical protein AM571_PA00059 (plasmid) [Rhizobium etli 8C-3]|uniref:Uncharacterized protein n=1 Tax=Rhizobium etli 8C-3 TaxID=538025 RepID=A0A1L5P9S8_RHIET|nr:hypothetical protein [Rhizobium etli]APO76947.1 hypothetical protein AM571_PA00059 [Rhizobium etli 8C-3]